MKGQQQVSAGCWSLGKGRLQNSRLWVLVDRTLGNLTGNPGRDSSFSIGGAGGEGMLPISACTYGETGLKSSKARPMLPGLGAEREPGSENSGEEDLWPELVGVEEEEEALSSHSPGKGKYLRGGEGEEARIRTACQHGGKGRLGTSGSGEPELLSMTRLPKGDPGKGGL